MISFHNQVVLVTGGSRGIGAATAIRFAAAGARAVIVHCRHNRQAAGEVAREVERAGAEALIAEAEISEPTEVTSLLDLCHQRFGKVDVVVANAGVWPPEDRPILDLQPAQWNHTLRVNLDGLYYLCRESVRLMLPQRSGNIIIVSSTAGQRGEAGHADYAASKGGAISLTKSLAAELGPFGIRVNCVAPGWVDTEMAAPALHGRLQEIVEAIPLRRIATADDVAGPILFLASDLARHLTGEIMNVNGGSVLCG